MELGGKEESEAPFLFWLAPTVAMIADSSHVGQQQDKDAIASFSKLTTSRIKTLNKK